MPLDRRSFREDCAWKRLLVHLEVKWDDDSKFMQYKEKTKSVSDDVDDTLCLLHSGLYSLGGYANAIDVIANCRQYDPHLFDDGSDGDADAEEHCIDYFRRHPDVGKFAHMLSKAFVDITPDELKLYINGVKRGFWGHDWSKRSLLDCIIVTNGSAGCGLAIDYTDFLYLEYMVRSAARNCEVVDAKKSKYGPKCSHFGLEVDPGWRRYYDRFAEFDLRIGTISGEEQSMKVLPDDTLENIIKSLRFFPDAPPELVVFVVGQEILDVAKWSHRLFDLNIGANQILTCMLPSPTS